MIIINIFTCFFKLGKFLFIFYSILYDSYFYEVSFLFIQYLTYSV